MHESVPEQVRRQKNAQGHRFDRAAGRPGGFTGHLAEVIEALDLHPIESCEVVNPFTGEPTTLDNSLELAAAVIDGRRVGVVRWCSHSEGLDIFGEPETMTPLAEAIAARIGGEFAPL